MPEPVVSGRNWEVAPGDWPIVGKHHSKLLHLRDENEHSCVVLFKTLNPEKDPPAAIYGLGMERVAYVLGEALGLPIATVHLEPFEDEPGALMHYLGDGPTWWLFQQGKMSRRSVTNQGVVPLCVAFDIWLANTDRYRKNIQLRAEPAGVSFPDAEEMSLWLIDHEQTGLWPPGKFRKPDGSALDPDGADLEEADLGDGTITVETAIRGPMEKAYWPMFGSVDPEERGAVLERVQALEQDVVAAAVDEIPDQYMTPRLREVTIELLNMRKSRLPELAEGLLR